jgi:hypothetical protein
MYSKDGKFLVRFDTGNTSTQFNLIQWDVTEETNSRYNISTRTDITSSTFKDLTNISSGVDFVSGSPAYGSDTGRYLDLLFSLNSDVTRVYAPIIKKFIVTYTTVGTGISKNWNTRISDIANNQLGWITENYSSNNVGYAIRCLETYADGYDSYNITSAILYLGLGLNAPSITSYHKLISQNLNCITLVLTDDLTSSSTVYGGINTNITFAVVLEIIDYIDDNQNY